MEVNKQNIKAIIFDFDETMYYSPTIKQYYIAYIKRTLKTLSSLSDEDIVFLMDKYGFTSGGEKRVSFGKNCENFGVTKEQWNNYRIKNFFQIDYDNAVTAKNSTYSELAKSYKLFIVSNEVKENLLYKAKRMKIDLRPFTEIIAPNVDNVLEYKSDKTIAYSNLITKYKLNPKEVLVVGDRYEVDIKPMETLGGSGILVKQANEIDHIFKNWVKGKE